MNILSALKVKKLNLQNTCTSYYDFLTCGHNCLDSLRCCSLHHHPPAQQEYGKPPGMARRGVKYFDVDDKAAEWYLDTRRSTAAGGAERKPCKRKFCFRFRVPLRHACRRRNRAATYSLPGRRVSPEFLCLLKQHHARMRGLEQLPRKYLCRRPSFSYYKYDAAAKRRHMRPGIDTAAPVEFTCTNMACTRHHRPCPCPPKKEVLPLAPLSEEEPPKAKVNTNKKRSSLFAKNKKNNQVVRAEKDVDGVLESQLEGNRLHRIYVSNPSLVPQMVNQESPKPPVSRSQDSLMVSAPAEPNFTPLEKIKKCPCPIDQPKWFPKACNQSICPGKTERFRRSRDPRCIEYENRPLFKAIQGASYESGAKNKCKKQKSCRPTNTTSDNTVCPFASRERDCKTYPDEDHCKIKADVGTEPPPENCFYASISSHIVERPHQRPDFYDQNDIEIEPNGKEGSIGYKSFVRRSEIQKIIDRCGGPMPKCKKLKPPPYCYMWSAVDPDIREAEKRRLAKHKCYQRQMFPDSKPYSYYWSQTNPDIRSQVKEIRRLKETERPLKFCRNYPDPNKKTCSCSRSTIIPSDEKTSSDIDDQDTGPSCSHVRKPKDFCPEDPWNRKPEASGQKHSPNKSHQKWSGVISNKLISDSDARTSKKPRLLPRLHAFAKRLLFPGSKGLHFKSNQSGSERPRHSAPPRNSSAAGSKKKDTSYKAKPQKKLCDGSSSPVDRKITFRDQARIQDMRGPRDHNLWAKQSEKHTSPRVFRHYKTEKNNSRTKTPFSSGSERVTYKRSAPQTNSCSKQPSCSTRQYKFIPKKSSGSESCSNWSSPSSVLSIVPQPPCQTPQPFISRAQREWEEHRERKKARRYREKCRPCTDYLLTSRAMEPRNPAIRRGVVTYRNHELTTELSDQCLIKPREQRFRFTPHCSEHRDKENYSRSQRRRLSDQCCDDSDVSRRSKSPAGSGRMRGGIDCRKDVLSPSQRHRYSEHDFPTSLSFKFVSKKRVQSTKPSNSPMHLFCFD
ncbi:hypothetical protein KR084_010449 [Drosophila pseudotakahashii]|nr:hypothetical protein KR084_010449 [Drosophila pseudotakahashii]